MDRPRSLSRFWAVPISRAATGSTKQYDSSVRATPSVARPRGGSAAGSRAQRRLSWQPTDGNRPQRHRPASRRQLSVAEATRNVSITGLRPLGITNCLNYGIRSAPKASGSAGSGPRAWLRPCLALGTGTGGNGVALQTISGRRHRPTPEIGGRRPARGHLVAGPAPFRPKATRDPGRSEHSGHGRFRVRRPAGNFVRDSPPGIDLDREAALQSFVREAIGRGLVASDRSSGGGLAVAVAEMRDVERPRGEAAVGGLGFACHRGCSGEPVAVVLRCRRATPRRSSCSQGVHMEAHTLGTVGGIAAHRADREGATGAAEERGSAWHGRPGRLPRGSAPHLGSRPGPRPGAWKRPGLRRSIADRFVGPSSATGEVA